MKSRFALLFVSGAVTGTTSNPSNIQPNCVIEFPTCFPTATGRLDFGASTDPNVHWNNLFTDPNFGITEFGRGTFNYNLPIANPRERTAPLRRGVLLAPVDPGSLGLTPVRRAS